MLTLQHILSEFNSLRQRLTIPNRRRTSLFNLLQPFMTANPDDTNRTLHAQPTVLDCLTEISISLSSESPHRAPFISLLHSVPRPPCPTILSPCLQDTIFVQTPIPGLIPASLDAPTTPSTMLSCITGPLVLHHFNDSIVVTWHSPHNPEIHQSNLDLRSLIVVIYILFHHLEEQPSFNGVPPLKNIDLENLSHDIFRLLNIDTTVFQLMPHIQITPGLITNNDLASHQSIITSTNDIACMFKLLTDMSIPTWYRKHIPTCSSRQTTLTHHLEFTADSEDPELPVYFNCYELTMDITPSHAATQRISQDHSFEFPVHHHYLKGINTFLRNAPTHIYLAILQHTLAGHEIPCMSSTDNCLPPSPHWPIIYFLPQYGSFSDPDNSSKLSIIIVTAHSRDPLTPAAVTPLQAIHLRHSDAIILHAFHLQPHIRSLQSNQCYSICHRIQSAYQTTLEYKFAPAHSTYSYHNVYWPFDFRYSQ